MKSAPDFPAPRVNINLNSAENESVAPQNVANRTFVSKDIRQRWGMDFVANGYSQLLESALGDAPQHTVDHVNCPACQTVDEIMKAD